MESIIGTLLFQVSLFHRNVNAKMSRTKVSQKSLGVEMSKMPKSTCQEARKDGSINLSCPTPKCFLSSEFSACNIPI